MLFKEILDQTTKRPSNSRTTCESKKKASRKPLDRRSNIQQKPKLCATKLNKRVAARSSGVSKSKSLAKPQSSRVQQTTKYEAKVPSSRCTKFDANIPSSTPVFTPIKKDKLPTSVTSSHCSLIELLQQYNTSTGQQQNFTADCVSLDKTVTPELSQVKTPEETLISPQLLTFREVISKLLRTVDSNHDFKSNTIALNQAFEDVQVAFKSLRLNMPPNELNSMYTSSKAIVSNTEGNLLDSRMQKLQLENASLHRQLHLTKNEMEARVNKSTTTDSDISLELVTIHCQNKALEQKISELTTALEQALCFQQSIVDANATLKTENEKLQEELLLKQNELAKSGDLFSFETKEIKKDVSDALQKVEQLKITLDTTCKMNHDLVEQAQVKDKEILRLADLNRGLQSSVSRLLEDLKKASKPLDQSLNIKSEVLKKVDQFLSPPFRKPIATPSRRVDSGHSFPKMMGDIPETLAGQNCSFHVLPSNQPQPIQKLEVGDSYGSTSTKSTLGSSVSPSLPNTDSVSCSMWSITSRDERDFNAGLASLDADIQRLQSNLNQLNV